MFYIRVDANEIIGMGHIMRCLSIAQEMQRWGEDVIFVVADQKPLEILQKRGFSAVCLHSRWNNLDTELDTLVGIVRRNNVGRILIDSYYITENYLKTLQKYAEITYLDDLDSFLYPVDRLINYNIYAETLNYNERYQRENIKTEFALGCLYAPLRTEFSGISYTTEEDVTKIIITSGGTDHYDATDCILQMLLGFEWFADIKCYVIVGKFNENRRKLQEHWGMLPNVELLFDVQNMAGLMAQCDIAVTAGGVTIYELMACGIPSVVYTLADNQYATAEYISRKGLMPWVGDIRKDREICMRKMAECLDELYKNRCKRQEISRFMQKFVDGKGCKRLAAWLLKKAR